MAENNQKPEYVRPYNPKLVGLLIGLATIVVMLSVINSVLNIEGVVGPRAFGAGTTYYVDAVSGQDTNTGTSPNAAWKSIAKINSKTYTAGSKVLFKRGQQWREELIIKSNGTSQSRITFGTYGAGANPVVNGSDVASNWLQHPQIPTVWYQEWEKKPQQVFFNGVRGTQESRPENLSAPNEWYWQPYI